MNLGSSANIASLPGTTAAKEEKEKKKTLGPEAPEHRDLFVPAQRRKLSDERKSVTHKFSVGSHEGYLTVGMYEDGMPGEIFIKISKEGSTLSGFMDGLAISISIGLQYGVPLKTLVDKLTNTRFEPSGFTQNPQIRFASSVLDYIARWLGGRFISLDYVCDTTWIQPKKLLRRWGFSQVILTIGHSGFLGRSEGWSDGRRNVSKHLGFAGLGPQAVVVSFQTRRKISIYKRYLEQIPRPPWVRCAEQGSCVMSVWEKKPNCRPGEESHVGSCRGLGGGLTSDAVGMCRLRRTGSHLLTVGWAGALSAVDLRCCVHASLPMFGSLGLASVPRHCRIYWREKSEATRVLGELHGASVSSPRTSN